MVETGLWLARRRAFEACETWSLWQWLQAPLRPAVMPERIGLVWPMLIQSRSEQFGSFASIWSFHLLSGSYMGARIHVSIVMFCFSHAACVQVR